MNCEACSFLEFPPPNFKREERLVLAAIKRNALESECRTCSMLWQGIEKLVGREIAAQFDYLVIYAGGEPRRGPMRADLILPYGTDGNKIWRRKVKLQFYVHPGSPGPWDCVGPSHDIAQNALDDSCIDLALGWLKDCTKQRRLHEACQPFESAPLPTRVIKIGNTDADLCLHISQPDQRGRFVALSHCWGGVSTLSTTLATFDEHVLTLPYSRLPQTFRDAVEVTRQLCIEYLWIDSICIIQDSAEDWAYEAARMALVYENSYVTIAADAAVDSTTGFLANPARRPVPMVSIECATDNNEKRSIIHVREKGALAWQTPFHSWDPNPTKLFGESSNVNGVMYNPSTLFADCIAPRSKLSTGGWVFQERILAPRTLHYSESELAWECRSAIFCECSSFAKRTRRGPALMKRTIRGELWKQIVTEYTALDLTFPSDRLPALSGLAEAMSRVKLGDEYLCGLWRKSLPVELLWCVSDSRPRDSRRVGGKWYAPTWSWASITGDVVYTSKGDRVSDTFEVLEVRCQVDPNNQFGSLKGSASMLVSGIMVPIKFPIEMVGGLVREKQRISPTLAARQFSGEQNLTPVSLCADLRNKSNKPYIEDPDSNPYFFLMIGGPSGGYAIGCPHGLILKRVENGDIEDLFERVGYAHGPITQKTNDGWSSDESSEDEGASGTLAEQSWDEWAALGEKRNLRIL